MSLLINSKYGKLQKQSPRSVPVKKLFLKISQNCQVNTSANLVFNKATVWVLQLFKKEAQTNVFFCEFWNIVKNTRFMELKFHKILQTIGAEVRAKINLKKYVRFMLKLSLADC